MNIFFPVAFTNMVFHSINTACGAALFILFIRILFLSLVFFLFGFVFVMVNCVTQFKLPLYLLYYYSLSLFLHDLQSVEQKFVYIATPRNIWLCLNSRNHDLKVRWKKALLLRENKKRGADESERDYA